jgi:heme/copper-type cytochrome/quinol oxidase subunit 1
MLLARLFALLAILLLGVGLLQGRTPHQSFDIVVHSTYFVIAHVHVLYVQALVSACFAVIYFAADRWMLHPLNNSLGLGHFGLVIVGFVLTAFAMSAIGSATVSSGLPSKIYIATARMSGESAPSLWPFFTFCLGTVSFLFGCAVFAVNLASTTVKVSRPH